METKLVAMEAMLKQMLHVDVPFVLQSKYQPMIDTIIRNLHNDIDDIEEKMVEIQESIDQQ